ncbi:hypothetical protein F5X68DRAFT_141404 [Plectosphaerella plurivora]|uniref:CRIB domain-containing protein n=1 Tax=Plectosphaerella plurivora TaxID=936078 RepID=A0A9P8V3Y6_9PEZI|nr:hypothetical protein F5X68DRAFT_141404 [Plectosphaerella plurivora]
MFAAAAPLPYYSTYGYSASRSKKATGSNSKDTNADAASRPGTRSKPSDGNSGSLLEPAVEGPPSSEKIRALNKQVQRASAANSSSQSSSLRSFATDSPSWEQTLEHVALSRHSSQRSTSSSMPSRPESVQLFGKTIFSRRSKTRRESSANSSSGSSLYSGEVPLDAPAAQSTKEQYVSGIFGRIKGPKIDTVAARARSNSAASRKLQISGPYNFQHVSHSRRDQPHMSPGRGPEPPSPAHQPQEPLSPSYSSQVNDGSPGKLVKRTRSSDHIRGLHTRSTAPARPPRSPADLSPTASSPPVPPRMSSRMSTRPEGWEAAIGTVSERPSTSGGFRQPQPFTIAEDMPEVATDVVGGEPLGLSSAGISLHAITTPGDAAWPLPANSASFSYEAALPDVPEEEEHVAAARRSRLSLASNSSSLRGSQSVPLLRLSAQLQAANRQRPPSAASDTLGRFEVLTARRASKGADKEDLSDSHARESWEDDIDYCYEHEAEADCNFVWERPSLELVREESGHTSYSYLTDDFDDYMGSGDKNMTSLMPVPSTHFDMPVFGSVSPGLGGSSSQMPSMVNSGVPVTSNFSHPRTYTSRRRTRDLHIRTDSRASSFKESHGFNLSPSLLIPGDFQRQMSLSGSDVQGIEHQDDAVSPTHVEGVSPAAFGPSEPFGRERDSTSTVDTASSAQTGCSGERHISTNSNFTAPTRYTGSTTFEGWDPKMLEASEPLPLMQHDDASDLASPKSFTAPRSPLSEPGDMMSHSMGDIRDELSKPDDVVQHPTKPRHRRQRANTTSLLNPSVGSYALFPPAYSGNRV